MGTVQTFAETVNAGLQAVPPQLRQTVLNTLALAVGARLEAQPPNPSERANVLPGPTAPQAVREPWRRRLVKTPRLQRAGLWEPCARTVLRDAAGKGQTLLFRLEQPALGDRCASLRLAVQGGARSVPLAWTLAAGTANIGGAGHQLLLERGRAGLPVGAAVVRWGARFYPATGVWAGLEPPDGPARRRLTANRTVDTGCGEATPGE